MSGGAGGGVVSTAGLNAMSLEAAIEALRRCCHSRRWAEQVSALRPFASFEDLVDAAETIWWKLGERDWLEAFAAHPKIGDVDSLRVTYAGGGAVSGVSSATGDRCRSGDTKDWSLSEQSGVAGAQEGILVDLMTGNKEYEEKFGHIFIVCATGKSAAEMLEILKARLPNDPETELRQAALEQSKITRIRLEKLCQEAR